MRGSGERERGEGVDRGSGEMEGRAVERVERWRWRIGNDGRKLINTKF